MRDKIRQALDEQGRPLFTKEEFYLKDYEVVFRALIRGYELLKVGLPFMLNKYMGFMSFDVDADYMTQETAVRMATEARRRAGVKQNQEDVF